MEEYQIDKDDKKLIKDLAKSVRANFGHECLEHPEECAICEIYKALKTIQRLYGFETN